MTTWCDASTAVQVVESGNNVFLQGMVTTPTPPIEALVARGEELQCALGPSVDMTGEAVDYARQVVALVNPQVPWAHGDSFVHVSRLDYAVKWEGPLHEVGQQAPNQIQQEIGRLVADLIEDGATLQLGIGAIPDAALQTLTDRRDLGIHSEMFSDGVLDLVERGVITGARKALDRGKMVASFLIGSRRLMDFLDDNPMVELRSISYSNDIEVIRQFDHSRASCPR
jgi:acyl-CoA hydrolase